MPSSFRILTLSGFILVAVLGCSTARAFQFVDPVLTINGFFCLEARDASDRTPVIAAHCNAFFFQEWNSEGFSIKGIGTTATASANKCLDVAGGGTADGTPVQLFTCNGTGAQQWRYADGIIQNVRAGKCLDIGNMSAGTQAVIRTCNGSTGQRWVIR